MRSFLFIALFVIASSHGAFGAPSCGQNMTSVGSCVSKCKSKFRLHSSGSTVQPTAPATGNSNDNGATSNPGLSSSPTTQPTPTPTPSLAPSPVPASSGNTSTGGSGDTSSSDIADYLSAHNSVRAQHGAAPLTWSAELSAVAQAWADGCQFKHSGGPHGENLAAGTGDAYTIISAVGSWTAEVSEYDPNNPVPSHFTQVVWKATTQVGCAHQDCSGIFPASYGLAHYHVCEYSPAGNVIGEFPQNVQV